MLQFAKKNIHFAQIYKFEQKSHFLRAFCHAKDIYAALRHVFHESNPVENVNKNESISSGHLKYKQCPTEVGLVIVCT